MSHIRKMTSGAFQACWRDPAGKKRAKNFTTKREASAFLAEIDATINRGTYVAPNAGKLRFHVYAERWSASRNLTARTTERTESILRNHLLPKWGDWPIGSIDHLSVQEWVTQLRKTLAPTTVGKCFSALRTILRSAMRARLITVDPTDGVTAPSTYQPRPLTATISREIFLGTLLPAVPLDHRAIVAAGGGAGLRWGEAAGLPWGAVDLSRGRLSVRQVAIETAATVTIRTYPKSRAGVRTIPLPDFLVHALEEHRELTIGNVEPDPAWLVFPTRNGTPQRRSNFRRQVLAPRAGTGWAAGQHRGNRRHLARQLVGQDGNDAASRVAHRTGGARTPRRARHRWSAVPRSQALLRHLARVRRRTDQHGPESHGPRTSINDAEPLYPHTERLRLARFGRFRCSGRLFVDSGGPAG